MTLTVKLNEKSTQKINFSDKVYLKNDGTRKTPIELEQMCKEIASDISKGNYESFKIN